MYLLEIGKIINDKDMGNILRQMDINTLEIGKKIKWMDLERNLNKMV